MKWYRNLNLGPKLIGLFLIAGLVPMIIFGGLAYFQGGRALREEAFAKLRAVRQIKTRQLANLFSGLTALVNLLKANPATRGALSSISWAFGADGNKAGPNWKRTVGKYDKAFKDLKKNFRIHDLLLLSKSGRVIYSVSRLGHLGQTVASGPLKTSGLGLAFARAKAGAAKGTTVQTDFGLYGPAGDKPACFIAAPVMDEMGQFVGVVALHLSTRPINAVMLERAGMGRTGETYLVGPDKLMRSDSFRDKKRHSVAASLAAPRAGRVDTPAARRALAGKQGSLILTNYLGEGVLSDYAPLMVGGFRWAIIAEVGVDEAFAAVRRLRNVSLIIGLILAALIVGMAFGVARSIARPVVELVEVSDAIAAGDLTRHITYQAGDELGRLADSLRNMLVGVIGEGQSIKSGIAVPLWTADRDLKMTHLNPIYAQAVKQILGLEPEEVVGHLSVAEAVPDRDGIVADQAREVLNSGRTVLREIVMPLGGADSHVLSTLSPLKDLEGEVIGVMGIGVDITRQKKQQDEIERQQEDLLAVAQEVKALAEQLASAATQISSSTDEMSSTTEQQSAQAGAVATSAERMNATVREAAQHAARGAEEAEAAGELAREGGRVVAETIQSINRISRDVTQVGETVQALSAKNESVDAVVGVIEDIADQTNLLALNAAIEAARAGEAGRGFAVVADEVRKLAEKTMSATKEVTETVLSIKASTQDAVTRVGETQANVAHGVELAARAGDMLEQIVGNATRVAELVSQIAAGAEEQTAATDEISKNVEGIAGAARESAAAIMETAGGAEALSSLAGRLAEAVD
ncbi:MAG: PAS domain-containing protein, partial [Proteobacteria bacterium]|nr:PAS domain-containing protein [Pseudomonadota bacterium]